MNASSAEEEKFNTESSYSKTRSKPPVQYEKRESSASHVRSKRAKIFTDEDFD